MPLITLIDPATAKQTIAQIDSDIIPDIRQSLLDAVDKLIGELDGMTITVRIERKK